MKLHLLKLIIWPKDTKYPPRIVEFRPGVLNVITGQSRTGKSAIIPIIDYCFASSDCFIPIDTIRDYASWYGIVFQTDSEEILLARAVPEGRKVSTDFFVLRGENISIPPSIDEANENQDGVKIILNTISLVPYFSIEGDESRAFYNARLGFRDLMAFAFQSQDIVANQNILFYKTHAHVHRERLRNWFPFILGAEDIEVLKARSRLQIIEQQLNRLRQEYENAKNHSDSWVMNIRGHLNVASEYGLVSKTITDDTATEDLIEIAKGVVENIPEYTQTSAENIHNANTALSEHEIEEEKLSSEICLLKKRLSNLRQLKLSFTDYGTTIRKRADRLRISEWLKDIASEAQRCPACGSKKHPNSNLELLKISKAFKMHEEEAKGLEEVPTSFSREELRLNDELDSLLKKQKKHQRRYDILIANNKVAQKEFQNRKNMYLFLGHLEASLETFESLGDGGELQEEISSLEEEYTDLTRKANRSEVRKKVEAAEKRISQSMLDCLKTLDVEEKYRDVAPRFTTEDLNIAVLSADNNWHYLAEVGSASNWVSFHLALICSLQRYFTNQKTSSIPSFVIFDQPSQVYFPKVNHEDSEQSFDHEYRDEDVTAVKQIFRTIADSIIAENGAWQAIVLDHADSSIYGDIKEGIHEVEIWRDGNKLIPEEWYA